LAKTPAKVKTREATTTGTAVVGLVEEESLEAGSGIKVVGTEEEAEGEEDFTEVMEVAAHRKHPLPNRAVFFFLNWKNFQVGLRAFVSEGQVGEERVVNKSKGAKVLFVFRFVCVVSEAN